MLMRNLLYGVLALALVSCGEKAANKPAGLLAENDFESLDGWSSGVNNPSLTKEQAHSGVYSVKVNPGIDYSLGYNNQLGKVSATRIHKMKLHAWVRLPNDKTTVLLVGEVKNEGAPKSVVWEGLDLLKEAQTKGFDKWIEVEKTFDLPESVTYNSQLLVYLWRGGSTQPAYLDDLQISRVD
jgi:hypothetical protein